MSVPLYNMFEKSIETTYNKTDTSSQPRTGQDSDKYQVSVV